MDRDLFGHDGTDQRDRVPVPFEHLLPSDILGILSLLVLAVAIPARHVFHMAGAWRGTYVITAAIALYLNVFVAVVQSFLKIPALHALAPAGKEPSWSRNSLFY